MGSRIRPVDGGARTLISDWEDYPRGTYWAADDGFWFAQLDGIYRVAANGGEPERMIVARDGEILILPQPIPDQNAVLFTVLPDEDSSLAAAQIVVESLDNSARYPLINGGSDGRLMPTGHLVYATGNVLRATSLNTETWSVGERVDVLEDVMQAPQSPVAQFDVSDDGTLVYVRDFGDDALLAALVWVERDGTETPLALSELRNYDSVRICPTGDRIAAVTLVDGRWDIWLIENAQNVPSLPIPITSGGGWETGPVWTQDCENLVYSYYTGEPKEVRTTRVDGTSEEPELLWTLDDTEFLSVEGWGEDERQIIFSYGPFSSLNIGLLQIDSDDPGQTLVPFLDNEIQTSGLSMSPDGDWIAYQSNEADICRIYIDRFPDSGSRRLISGDGGGMTPRWSQDGREVYFRRLGDSMMMGVSVATSPELETGQPEELFPSRNYGAAAGCGLRAWDVGRDGRFLMVKTESTGGSREIVVVQNWFDELERLLPTE